MKHRQAMKVIRSDIWDFISEGKRDKVRSVLMKRTDRDIKRVHNAK